MNSVLNVSFHELDGIELFLNDLGDYLPYTIVTIVGIILGIIGNLLIIIAICRNRNLQTKSNIIILNLALSDLLISALIDTFTVVGVLAGKAFFLDKIWLCHLIATFVMILCMCSLANMWLLAFNRYMYICKKKFYGRIFSRGKTIIYCILTWSIGLVTEIVAVILIGWEVNYFDAKTLGCTWNRIVNKTYTLTLMIVSIVIPCVFISFFYLKIYIYALKAKRRAFTYRTRPNNNLLMESFKFSKGLFGSFLIFTICWLPYALNIILDLDDKVSQTVYIWTIQLAMINSCLNPVLYAFTNSKFKKAFLRIFNSLTCQIKTRTTSTRINKSTLNDNSTEKF